MQLRITRRTGYEEVIFISSISDIDYAKKLFRMRSLDDFDLDLVDDKIRIALDTSDLDEAQRFWESYSERAEKYKKYYNRNKTK